MHCLYVEDINFVDFISYKIRNEIFPYFQIIRRANIMYTVGARCWLCFLPNNQKADSGQQLGESFLQGDQYFPANTKPPIKDRNE